MGVMHIKKRCRKRVQVCGCVSMILDYMDGWKGRNEEEEEEEEGLWMVDGGFGADV